VRWKINAVTVVTTTRAATSRSAAFDRAYGGQQTEQARELWTFNRVNFARIAEEMGALGIRSSGPPTSHPRSSARSRRAAGRDRCSDGHRRDRAYGGA